MDIKDKLNKAFRALRKAGYFAKQDFECCQSCGCAAVPDTHQHKYVFYHRQDRDYLRNTGKCYLAWNGNGEEIVKILRDAGIKVGWDGSDTKRIEVSD